MQLTHITYITYLLFTYFAADVLAKGGGRSGGGRSGSGRSGSGSGSGKSYKSGSGGNPRFSSPSSAHTSKIGSYGFASGSRTYSHGGYGYHTYRAPVYVSNRYYYTNYYPTYGGYWGYGYPYGWYGYYNPALLYWYYVPYYSYPGYHTKYYRYNAQNGAYYAPQLDVIGNGSLSVLINTTEYTDETNNYHTTFDYSVTTGFPVIDSAYFSTSDREAQPADFYMRLTFWQFIEYNDTNNNNAFEDGVDTILYSVPLNQVIIPWASLTFQNKTVETNRTYQEATTTATLATTLNQNNTRPFKVSLTFRATNIQINSTFVLPTVPNAAMFDLLVTGYNFTSSSSRFAILTILSTTEDSMMDINSTTPADVAQQIKTNITVGASIGQYSEGRVEWKSSVNVNNLTSPAYVQNAQTLVANKPSPIQSWLVFNYTTPNLISVLAMTVPVDSLNVTIGTANISGFTFLDVDVLNNSSSAWRKGANTPVAILMAIGAAVWLLL